MPQRGNSQSVVSMTNSDGDRTRVRTGDGSLSCFADSIMIYSLPEEYMRLSAAMA
jgi:hypothetical protein